MVREELISSADPSVASAPIDKRISFLQSKNLTKEEIDVALARAGEDPSVAAAASSTASGHQSAPQQAVYRPPPPAQGYGYPPYGQWQPPPEPPKRDWRDWFIMATVMGGVSYGLYSVAKRYISPLIAPPTPPQIEQDKQNIDEQFSRAFALIEQLSTDTAALKTAEEARTEKLDGTLRDVETLLADLKSASRRRDDETRRINDEINALKDAIPRALQGAREGNENRLRELGTELKSLKTLLGNRLGSAASGSPVPPKVPDTTPNASEPVPSAPSDTNGTTASPAQPDTASASTPTANPPNPLSRFSKSPSIPAWQLAAANRSKTASPSTPASTADGSTTEQSPSRARSRSPTRDRSPRHGHSRHHRHRNDDRDYRHRHRHRHGHGHGHSHSHSHRRSRSRSHSSKQAAEPAPITLPFNSRELTKRDLELFEPMFAMYLDIQKGLILEDLSREEVKGRWKSFVGKWNRGELAEGWYDPATLERARKRAAEAAEAGSMENEYGYEIAQEDALADRHDARQMHRAEIHSHKSSLRHMEEEVAPRAEPGTHERRMEKRREAAAANRAFADARRGGSPIDAAPDDELMGSGENDLEAIKKAKEREQRKKNEREIRREEILRARTAEREERVRRYKEKEEETIGWLKTLAKQRFG
ncbi:peroxisomal membrane anchor protein conserved region-domain-containing protein [Aspergillus egyptiacus]|nr:peroxisomal membrane anchor protein conserved region-domain-containing protein [Aspergillus egyptiacus]